MVNQELQFKLFLTAAAAAAARKHWVGFHNQLHSPPTDLHCAISL